jgi:putative transposase
MKEIQFFDREQAVSIVCKRLPHWSQAGTVAFITWRTADSMPPSVVARWVEERSALLGQFGIAEDADWHDQLEALPIGERQKLQWSIFENWDNYLDRSAGDCVLERPELSQIVADSLQHFDEDRYLLTDFVVMPNHVHLLAAFADDDAMLAQCASWKRFTARQINEALGRKGELWQTDGFDHLVRSPEQFERFRRYIADNPKRANLRPGSYRLYSKNLSQ